MKKMMNLFKRYKVFLGLLIINLILVFVIPDIGMKAFQLTKTNLLEMLAVIPPIFILLGLLDVWVKKETMIKFMGENSGITGVLIAYFLGAAAAGPLYAAFPVAGILLKKGSKISNVLIFIGAWSTMKIPLLLFETSALGMKFSMLRLGINIIGIFAIAFLMDRILKTEDKEKIYNLAKNMQ